MTAAQTTPSLLAVWDFDHSLIDENCDLVGIQNLDADLYTRVYSEWKQEDGWTKFVDDCCKAVWEAGLSLQDMERELSAHCTIAPSVVEVVKKFGASERVRQVILSDANDVYIRAVLGGYGLIDCFDGVYTNYASLDDVDEGRLRVRPYHSEPHGCERCPKNLCKGKALYEDIGWAAETAPQTLYVGDGGGDYCPCSRLRDTDTVCARAEFTLSNLISEKPVKAQVKIWDSGDALAAHLTETSDAVLE